MDLAWQKHVEERLAKLDRNDAVKDVHIQQVGETLSEIKDTLKWIFRLFVGAVGIALTNFVIQGGLVLS